MDQDEQRTMSVEEVPIIQADLTYGDIQRDGTLAQSRPHLLTITMLPPSTRKGNGRPGSPPIPPHPMVVQRRMELLTSDMLSRALTLVSRNQHERAQTLLKETRTILRGLGKGGLPPLPAPPSPSMQASENGDSQPQQLAVPTPALENNFSPAAGIDVSTSSALDAELESSLEWINHPAVFSRDSRKAVLQAIGVISSQRGITFRLAKTQFCLRVITDFFPERRVSLCMPKGSLGLSGFHCWQENGEMLRSRSPKRIRRHCRYPLAHAFMFPLFRIVGSRLTGYVVLSFFSLHVLYIQRVFFYLSFFGRDAICQCTDYCYFLVSLFLLVYRWLYRC
jgi:hypothetical protein